MTSTDKIKESFADIEALARRITWELMDEDQRDEFMEKVVVPRWGKTTSDGVTLKATAWAQMVGTTRQTIEARYLRLRRSEAGESATRTEPNSRYGRAVRTLRNQPADRKAEVARELLADPQVIRQPSVAMTAMKALDQRYEDSPKPIPVHADDTGKPMELVYEFRRLHRSVDAIIRLVIEGKAVVSDTEREAVLREVAWLRTALGYVEDGIKANSLERELAEFMEANS